MTTHIYTLSNPLTNEVKYIGKTINIKERYNTYIKQAKHSQRNNLVINWIKSLLCKGLKPKMEILDSIDGEWQWLEKYWISQFKTWGFNLKNTTAGGDSNPMDSEISRIKISKKLKGLSKSENHKNKISNAKIGVSIHTDEQKLKYKKMNGGENNPMFGKQHTKESIEKMRLPIIQYTLDGIFIKEWSSAVDVEAYNSTMLARSINRCAKGNRQSAYGFKWKYQNNKGRG